MADLCATYTYAGITINPAKDANGLLVDPENGGKIEGLDGKTIRRQVDPKAGTDGGRGQEAHFGHRIITFAGTVHIGAFADKSPVGSSAYQAALVGFQKAVVAAFEAQLDSAATLAWTDATGASRSISCKYGMPDGEIKFGGTVEQPTFSFALFAEDPDISG